MVSEAHFFYKTQLILRHAIFLIIAMFLIVNAALYDIPSNESMRGLNFFKTDARFQCDNIDFVNRFFGDSGCYGVIDALCMENTETDVSSINISFQNDEERQVFSDVIAKLDRAEKKHKEAMQRRETLFINLGELILNVCGVKVPSTDTPLHMMVGNVPIAEGCFIASSIYDYDASQVVETEAEAIKEAAEGMNELTEILKDASDELYWAGAPYENYSGEALSTYIAVKDFTRMANYHFSDSAGSGASGVSAFAKRWSSLYFTMEDLHEADKNNITSCAVSKFLTETLDDKGIVPAAVDFYRRVKGAHQQMLLEYNQSRYELNTQFEMANNELKELKNAGYYNISKDDVEIFMNYSQMFKNYTGKLKTLIQVDVPVEKLNRLDSLLNDEGIDGSVAQIRKETDKLDSTKQFYLAKAIEKQKLARNNLAIILQDLSMIKNETIQMRDDAKVLADVARTKALKTLESYPQSDISSYLKSEANERIEEADAIIVNLSAKGEGYQFKDYIAAISKYNEATAYLSKEGSSREVILKEIDLLFSEFKRANTSAVIDGISVETENIPVSSLEALAKLQMKDLEYIKVQMRNITDTIYLKAKYKYSYLDKKRLEIFDELKLMKETDAATARELSNALTQYEKFVVNNSYDPRLAIGNFSNIDSLLMKIDNQLAATKTQALESYLSRNAKVTKIFQTAVSVDSNSNVTYLIEIINDLKLGSNESIKVSVTGVRGGPGATISKPDGTYIRFAEEGKGIDILFTRLDVGPAQYRFNITSEAIIAKTTQRKEERLRFDETLLERRMDLTIDSLENVKAIYNETLPIKTDVCEASIRGKTLPVTLTSGELSVAFNAEKGENLLSIICRSYKPLSITEHDQSVVELNESKSQVTYYVRVSSRVGEIEDVIPYITIEGELDRNTIKVYDDISNTIASNLTFKKIGENTIVSWYIPFLTNEGREYKITYQLDDMKRYLDAMRVSLSESAKAESIDISTQLEKARRSTSLGRYDEAFETLQEAKRTMEAERILRLEKNTIISKLTNISSSFETLENQSLNFTRIGFGEITLEIDKKASDFSIKRKEIERAVNENKTDEAFKLLKELEKISSSLTVEDILSKRANKMYNDLSDLKKDFFVLNKAITVTDEIENIETLEEKFANVSSAIKEGNTLTAALLMNEFEEELKNIRNDRDNITSSLTYEAQSLLDEIKNYNNTWKKKRQELLNMIDISSDSPVASNSQFQKQKEEIESLITDTDRLLAEGNEFYTSLKNILTKKDIDTLLNNLDNIKTQKEKLSRLNASVSYSEKLSTNLKMNTRAALDATKIVLAARAKNASKEELTRLETVAGYVNKAGKLFEEGKYLDSLAYISYANEKLKVQEKEGFLIDPMLIVAVIICIAATIAALSLLNKGKEKPEESQPHILKKAEQ
jgi:hypothetical protein